jgi:diguanylate cyclase (GGDEF)-like protein
MGNPKRHPLRLRRAIAARNNKITTMAAQISHLTRENAALQEMITGLELENDRLRIETFTDPLTGLYNRVGLRHIWNEVACDVTAVMVLDSDRFKAINDRYGHPVGDIVLCYLAETIRDHGIIASRTGGDEFIGLLVDPDPLTMAEDLRTTVSRAREINGNDIVTTVTIGLCLVDQAPNGLPVESLMTYLERADHALYEGKRGGRNTVTTTK